MHHASRLKPWAAQAATLCHLGLLALWAALLLALCSWELAGAPWPVSLLGAFYRAGSFAVGGDVALSPLLLTGAVPRAGSAVALLRARATAQILPGPAAGMAAYLGGANAGPAGALVAGPGCMPHRKASYWARPQLATPASWGWHCWLSTALLTSLDPSLRKEELRMPSLAPLGWASPYLACIALALTLALTLLEPGLASPCRACCSCTPPFPSGLHSLARRARRQCCTPAHLHTCTPAHLHTCTYLHTPAHICTRAHTCTPAHICTPAPAPLHPAPTCHPPATHLPPTCHPPASQAVLRGVRAAAAGLLITATLLLFEAVRSPPERAIALLVFAALNIDPARLPSRLGERFVPPLATLAGAVLGVPLCLQVLWR